MTGEQESGLPLAGCGLLLVEDETLVAMLLEDMVADLGGRVLASAARVENALQILGDTSLRFDLAVLDVNLGGEQAFPVAEVLARRGVPFVFSTGYGTSGLPDNWRRYPTLNKPFTEEQVRGTLVAALRNGALPAAAS